MDNIPNNLPDRVHSRVQDDPEEYLARDLRLTKKYQYGDEISHEPVKAIQKEIDGMARLLCRIAAEDRIGGEIRTCVEIYEDEVSNLRELEHQIISQLPDREPEG